ncbi:cyclin-like protein [Gloeopeniophorella convolvens]|nr:cyclin-like protein [Gloeopeniophorella convolvens]
MQSSPTTPNAASPQKIPLFQNSTQYKNWRFSREQLRATRTALNEGAIAAIRNTFEADSPGSSSDIQFLDADEERLLMMLYISKISQLCGHFRFPEEIEATGITYLKRFYLKNTVMDWHPKNVMLTALFLAAKTTNHPISLESYTSNIPRTSPSDVLDLEFLVAQSLAFEFAVWHAHRALWGMWLDIQELPQAPPHQELQRIYDSALQYIRTSRLTDAELIYPPSQIALACLSLAHPEIAASWARSKNADAVLETVEIIKQAITRDGNIPSVDVVREIDRRLKICKNPEKVVGSNAYLAKKSKEEKEAELKRIRKAESIKKAVAEGDPFGEELAARTLDDDD